MSNPFEAVRVTDHVYWVGAIDWAIRDFHGYSTRRGTTYNAYLILADKITLIDTVKEPFKDEMLARIASVVEPEKIDYVISNHAEMDHSGCLPAVIDLVRPKKVFASKMGVKALGEHFHPSRASGPDDSGHDVVAVADGQKIDLGGMSFSFVETRMCHWPDSMVTYLHEDQVLFSQDGFGMHLATTERFDDEIDDWLLAREAAKYYANILLPLSGFIRKALDKVSSLNLPLAMVAPDHGPIWRKDTAKILGLYARWAEQKPTNKAVVVYDTMWQSTAAMARAIGDGLAAGGASVRLLPLDGNHRSDVATHLLDAGALVVGSPTLNNCLFPTVADCLTYLKGLRRKNLIGAAFGSHGWSGEGARQVHAMLEEMDVAVAAEPLAVRYVPDADALARCRRLGLDLAGKLRQHVAASQ